MDEAPCTLCNGVGEVVVDDLHVRKCICVKRRALRAHLGDEIFEAPKLMSSPLFSREKLPDGTTKITDLTKHNLFIYANSWNGLLPHLRWALGNKGTEFYFRVITDETIKRCFVGGMAYKSKRLEERDTEKSFNTLADLVGEVCDLVIIKLGWLGYKNIAASGACHEALLIRENLRLPTWVVTTDSHEWKGSHSYSAELETYMERRRFQQLSIKSEIQDNPDLNIFEDTQGMGIESDEPPQEEGALVPKPEAGTIEEPTASKKNNLLDGTPRFKGKGKFNKKPSGKGPLGDI